MDYRHALTFLLSLSDWESLADRQAGLAGTVERWRKETLKYWRFPLTNFAKAP
jgi:hypothetical protein